MGVLGSHDAWPTDVTASPADWVEQYYFGAIKFVLFKNEETLIHVAHAFPRAIPIGYMLERKGLPMGTVQYLGRGHRPTPDSRFLATVVLTIRSFP